MVIGSIDRCQVPRVHCVGYLNDDSRSLVCLLTIWFCSMDAISNTGSSKGTLFASVIQFASLPEDI